MEGMTLLLLCTVALTAVLFLFRRDPKRVRFIEMVNKLPGPPAYPLVGTVLPFILAPRHKRFKLLLERFKKYKSIYRAWLGPTPTINVMKPEFIEVILGSTKHIEKSFSYDFLHPWLGTGLLTSSGQKWHTHRKMITPTFHFKILDSFVEVFSENSEILVRKLQKEVGQTFDMYPYITRCALDIICETAMGTSVHAQDNIESSYITAVYNMSELTLKRMIHFWLHPDFIFKLSSAGRQYKECVKILQGFTNKVIRERKAHRNFNDINSQNEDDNGLGKKKRVAFLDMLLEASEGGTKLTDEELREEVDTFMFEGHDTTSAGMSWAIYFLGLHQDVQVKAYEELENIFQGSDRTVTMKDLNDMKYLERVIKEALRLCPSVPGIGRILREDVHLGEYTIPAGSTLHVHIYCVHRNPDHFPNPEKFDPDNFLPERVTKRHPYTYIPFSAGPRNCIGQKFALLEEKTVVSYVLRHYKVHSLDKMEDINMNGELVLRPDSGIRVILTPRN